MIWRDYGGGTTLPFVPTLGWKNYPGIICSDEDIGIWESFWSNGQRVSRPHQAKKGQHRVAVLGCSYTKGSGVHDDDTFVYRLNQRFPNTVFDNYGVTGYGPYQCMTTMRQQLALGTYDTYMYCLITDHMNRFVQPEPTWITEFSNDQLSTMPWMEPGPNGVNIYHPAQDKAWPGARRWRSIAFFNSLAIVAQQKMYRAPERPTRIAMLFRAIIDMQIYCQQYGKRFILVVLENNYNIIPPLPNNVTTINAIYPLAGDILEEQYRVGHRMENHPNRLIHNYWSYCLAKWWQEHQDY